MLRFVSIKEDLYIADIHFPGGIQSGVVQVRQETDSRRRVSGIAYGTVEYIGVDVRLRMG